MAHRANDDDVRALIPNTTDIDVRPFIKAANSLVDKVSSNDTGSELSSSDLALIETWLAAHFYGIRDQQYQNKRTGDASATFQGKTGFGLDLTHWGQMAKVLDTTGYLESIDVGEESQGRKTASMAWLGLPPSDQTDYVDRD